MFEPGPLKAALHSAGSALPSDATRLFHGRGHRHPGLEFINVDWFAPVVWAVAYGEVADADLAAIKALLSEFARDNEAVQCVYLQRRDRGEVSMDLLYGALPERCFAIEDGARYELCFGKNQNIGFFLDARPGRQWLVRQAPGKRVLNLFAYTCAFSVAALRGGADKVVNIDMARSAIATGQRNHALNNLPLERANFLPHDIFRSTRKLEKLGPFDLVVIDPPSRQKGSFEADKDYGRLLGKLDTMLSPDASILACLNAPYLGEDFLPALFTEHLPGFNYVQRLAQRADFPEADRERCLKMQVFKRVPPAAAAP